MSRQGLATIEYMMLIMIVLGALAMMGPYIKRALNGHWKASGDTFGMSRQYQAAHVTDCAFAQIAPGTGVWYDDTCYQYMASTSCKPGDAACENTMRQQCAQPYCCEEPNCTQ